MSEAPAEQATETEQTSQVEGAESTDEGTEALGDAGKKALDAMKAKWKEAEAREKANAAELEKLRNASKSEQEKAVDAARKEGESEATQRANDRLIKAEAKVLAATAKFRDPSDVIVQLANDLKSIEVDSDGEVDAKALKALVEKLAKDKPYLVNSDEGTASASDAGIGTRGSSAPADVAPGMPRMQHAYANSPTK